MRVERVGSIRAVTNDQGQVDQVVHHDFLPFGEELAPQSPPHDKRLFTGQERDFETGQDYFNARQLRTDLGRFLTPDPIALAPRVVGSQGINSYAYVLNNPLSLIDPTGLDAQTVAAEVPEQYSDWTPTTTFGGHGPDSLDESFEHWDRVDFTLKFCYAYSSDYAEWRSSQPGTSSGGSHPATEAEIAQILAAAEAIVKKHLKYSQIVCTTFLMQAINDAFPGAVHDGKTWDVVLQLMKVAEPSVGAVMQFKAPTHVVFVTGVANGQVTQFLGSQGHTGPAYVNLQNPYWSKYYNLPNNVTFYQIMLPNR